VGYEEEGNVNDGDEDPLGDDDIQDLFEEDDVLAEISNLLNVEIATSPNAQPSKSNKAKEKKVADAERNLLLGKQPNNLKNFRLRNKL